MLNYPYMLNFWERVRGLLTDDLNQAWLCRKIKVNSSTMSAWINRDRLPKADLAVQIAQALGVSVEFLVTGEDQDDESDLSAPIPVEMKGPFVTPSHREYTLSTDQKVINVPIWDQKVSAGHGETLIEEYQPEKVLPVLERLVAHYDRNKRLFVRMCG